MRHFATSDAVSDVMTSKTILTQSTAVTRFSLAPDSAQAHRFLDTLAGSKAVTFQTLSDRNELKIKRLDGTIKDPNARILHGTLEQHQRMLERLNAKGAGVYVMVNAGDGKGRTADNVTEVRALFIDTDGAPFPVDLPLKPHLVVESSPGRYHLYWLVSGLELDSFAPLQKALAGHYGTDPAVHDLPRVMRLPGFYHNKAEPVMVQLLEAHDYIPYTAAETFRAWPFLIERLEHERVLEAERERQLTYITRRAAERRAVSVDNIDDRARAERLLQAHHDTVASAGEGTRHETLKKAAYTLGGYVAGGYLESYEVEDVLQAAASVCGLPDAEAADVIRWGLAKGAEKPLEIIENTTPKARSASTSSRRKRLMEWYK
jgi:hypothetical protein